MFMKPKKVLATILMGLGAQGAFAQWTGGSSPVINRGESVTISSTQPNIVTFTDNGTLTFAAGGSVTVTGTVVTAVGSGAGQSGALNLAGGSVAKTGNGYLVIGYLGGTGSLSIAAGSTLTSTSGRVRIAGNEDGQRDWPSRGEAAVSGYLNADILEFTGFFPTNLTPPYAEYARLTLNAGGVVEANQLQKNDCAATTLLFNGGTLRAKATQGDFIIGRGVMSLVIADGTNAVFDTNGKNVTINPQAAPYDTVLTLRGDDVLGAAGNGGLVKAGAGALVLRLPASCNTFTGAVTVLAGTLDLGRPLAENQTATVSAGANFVLRSPADLAKVTFLGGGGDRMVYTVAVDTGDLDLVSLNATFYDDRLGGPFTGSAVLSNTLTHAARTVGSPFRLIGQGGTLNLTNTTLETEALQVEGAGTFNFMGSRTFTSADAGKLVITDGGYRQEQICSLADVGAGTPAALSLATGRFQAGSLLNVGVGGFGTFSASGAAVTVGKLQVGGGTGFAGAFNQSTGVVTVSNESYVGLDGGTGTLTVAGGQFIVNSDLRVASNPNNNTSLRPQGTVTVSNGLFRCNDFRMTSWWPNAGSVPTWEAGLLTLLPGGVAEVNSVQKNDDPISTIQFSGGLLRARAANSVGFLNAVQAFGTLRVTAEAGHYAAIDTQAYGVTVAKPTGKLTFSGAGGLKKLGSGRLTFSANQVAYAGDTVVEAGVLRLGDHYQIPHGPGTGHVQLASGTLLELNGKSETVNRLVGLGLVINTNAPATLGVLADGSDATWDRTWLNGAITLDKLGAGTLTLAAAQAAPTNLVVSAGTVRLASADGFPFYRFKIEGIKNPAANAMQLSEIALYNDGVNVTPSRAGIAYDSTGGIGTVAASSAFPAGEMPEKAVDGIVNVGTTVGNKWLDFRANALRSAADKERVWLRINFAAAQKITHYNWATGNDAAERDPAAWRLQGSYDGMAWTDLDVKTGYSAIATRNAWVTSGGFPVSSVNTADVVNDNAQVLVKDGAALVLEGVSETVAGLSGLGTVTVNGADLTVSTPAGTTNAYFGSVTGSGSLIKTGSGEWGLGGSNTISGTLSVRQGTLAVLGGTADRWFRYTLRANRGATNVTQLSEFALFSADGTRRNLSLTQGAGVATLQPGQFACPAVYELGNPATETADKLFDSSTATKWCLINNFLSPVDPATHRVVVMRLAEGTPEITGYNLCTANDAPERDPVGWTLECSPDGVSWRTVDERAAVVAPGAFFTWYNGGAAFVLTARAVTSGAANVLAPGMAVEVRAGATFDCRDGADAVSALHVDMLDAGSLTVFKAAPSGTLTVANASGSPAGLVLPLTIGSVENRSNLRSWAVYVNGVLQSGVTLGVSPDGHLQLFPKGMLISVH